jgi:hypothetical protein
MAVSMKMTAYLDITSCSLVEVDQHSRGSMHLRKATLSQKAVILIFITLPDG